MKRNTLFLSGLLGLLAACSCASDGPLPLTSTVEAPSGKFDPEHKLLDDLLVRFVHPEGVDYQGLAKESDQLETYLASLSAVPLETFVEWSRDERFAFWANAYNAYILRLILDNYPVDSIRDLGGKLFGRVWDHQLIPLGHLAPELDHALLSFNDIEHGILRPQFQDARVHAAVNCASTSCPPLGIHAFVGARLETQLEAAMTGFVGDETRNHLDRKAGSLAVSSIFDWFIEDFERDAGSVRAYLRRYAGEAGGEWMESAKLSYLDYSWALNDASAGTQ